MAAHSPDEIYQALLALRETGTTSQAVRSQPVLTQLRYVVRAATTEERPQPTPNQLAAAARLILGTRNSATLHERRSAAARQLALA